MKYLIFSFVCIVGVPGMAFAASTSDRIRGGLLTALIVSTILGDMANINFFSTEFYRGPDRGFEVTLTDLIAWALIIALLIRYPSKINWVPYNTLWMVAFFGIACLASFQAPERLLASFTLFKFIRIYAVYWCIVNCIRTGTSYKYIWYGFIIIGLMITFIAIKQKYLDGITRIPGTFDHSNTNPSYLNLIIPILLIWGLYDKRLTRTQMVLTLLCVFGMVFAITATLSRAGIFLAVCAMLGVLAIANMRLRSTRVMFTSAAVCMLLFMGGIKALDTIIARFENAPKESAQARTEFNTAAALMLNDHASGVGLNNFSHVLTVRPRYHAHFRVMAGEVKKEAGVVHNIYLLTAAEMGYAGIIIFVIILIRFIGLTAYRGWRFNSLETVLLVGICMGLGTLYMGNFLEWTLRISPVFYMFAIISGMGVALSQISKQHAKSMTRS